MIRLAVALAVVLALPAPADARVARNAGVMRRFSETVPCPATGQVRRSCPGYTRDHFIPLCAGGDDAFENIWFEDMGRAEIKDRFEDRLCARLRRGADRATALRAYLRDVETMGGVESDIARATEQGGAKWP